MSTSIPYGEAFTKINSTSYYYDPGTTSSSSKISEPSMILIFPWLNAQPRHINKYVQGYLSLYPSSKILITTTDTIHITLASSASRIVRIQPVIEALSALERDEKVLLHTFSNGGASTVTVAAKEYAKKTQHPLPVSRIVFDSSPGKATYAATVRVFTVSLPKNIFVRFLGHLIIRFVFALWYATDVLLRRENLVATARRDLNDPRIIPVGAQRLYVYSEGDRMVDWRDVEEHAREAEEKGYVVRMERFGNTPHAGHLVGGEDRYWGAVRGLWNAESVAERARST